MPCWLKIGEADDVAEHRAVGINPDCAALAANAAQFFGLQSFLECPGLRVRQFALQNDVAPTAGDLFRDLVRRNLQARGEKRDERAGVVDQRPIGHHRRDRDVLRENFVVGVVDRAALRRDDVASDIFLRRQLGCSSRASPSGDRSADRRRR